MNKLSLFSGIFGDDLASEWAGIETICCVENNLDCQNTIKKLYPNMPIIGDVRDVTPAKVKEGYPNTCSMLYSACWRAARSMGYTRLITYILKSETGISLVASGFRLVGECGGGTWNRSSRPRVDTHPTEQKKLFEVTA